MATTFGKTIDSGTTAVCKVNGYMIAKEGETFTVDGSVNKHKYCHGSTIPYDLTGNANATVNITTWGGVTLNKDTFKTTVKPVNDVVEQSKSYGENSAKGTVICQSNGTWKLGSGYHNMTTVGAHSFVVINGAKKINKQFTIELWGGQGATWAESGGKGGYTKLVSQLGNKFNEGTTLYIEVGGKANGSTGGSNGGGNGSGGSGGGGGGATHFATKSGELSSLEGNKSSVIAVAGGGGGAGSIAGFSGGAGGGANMNGSDGAGEMYGTGGTLTAGGCIQNLEYYCGGFGQGGSGYTGGGGGYYGGGGGDLLIMHGYDSGGGGSGYCNTSYGSCSGSSGSRSGNGYAKITW